MSKKKSNDVVLVWWRYPRKKNWHPVRREDGSWYFTRREARMIRDQMRSPKCYEHGHEPLIIEFR